MCQSMSSCRHTKQQHLLNPLRFGYVITISNDFRTELKTKTTTTTTHNQMTHFFWFGMLLLLVVYLLLLLRLFYCLYGYESDRVTSDCVLAWCRSRLASIGVDDDDDDFLFVSREHWLKLKWGETACNYKQCARFGIACDATIDIDFDTEQLELAHGNSLQLKSTANLLFPSVSLFFALFLSSFLTFDSILWNLCLSCASIVEKLRLTFFVACSTLAYECLCVDFALAVNNAHDSGGDSAKKFNHKIPNTHTRWQFRQTIENWKKREQKKKRCEKKETVKSADIQIQINRTKFIHCEFRFWDHWNRRCYFWSDARHSHGIHYTQHFASVRVQFS